MGRTIPGTESYDGLVEESVENLRGFYPLLTVSSWTKVRFFVPMNVILRSCISRSSSYSLETLLGSAVLQKYPPLYLLYAAVQEFGLE